ncbi:MAG: BPTD_3080 family restriction endonuclease [Verrucomicrobiales bacterium]|nr:DEAD/DEAH box helicase family protein [Verrucomicrobiota bacterium JB025]
MSNAFFEKPILNSPYFYPRFHWELDEDGQPTEKTIPERRKCSYVTPVPKPKKRKGKKKDDLPDMFAETVEGIAIDGQVYDQTSIINEVRSAVDSWRALKDPRDWGVTPETARLLQHWRHHKFAGLKPFFCQVEAVETAIWLTEVAPRQPQYKKFRKYLEAANHEANPELFRIALKLATGAGKTTVMAMIIAWQTVNANRRPNSKQFSNAFLIVAPGITIRDRLRVLLPNDTESYYLNRELVPDDMRMEIGKARIVITNYHAFQLREKVQISAGGKKLLKGRGPDLQTKETESEMVRRVMGDLMGSKSIVVLNDEAHHCYREKTSPDAEETVAELKGDEKKEAQKQNQYARLWISGLEAVKRTMGVSTVFDLSATPFFLAGSGYREGTLFPWVMSDFSLMDAIECGIVKLPRVPIADNTIAGKDEMPKLRVLWDALKEAKQSLPKSGRGKAAQSFDPLALPPLLITALDALYGQYVKTTEEWKKSGIEVPPVFIVVCQNTAISDLVYRYISGFEKQPNKDGTIPPPHIGHFPLFQNYDETTGQRLPRPNTLLIDSEQIESGEALDKEFRKMAEPEIERFRRELIQRTGNPEAGKNISDSDLLREVMNTVGKKGRLGEQIRCVVSVSMLTEGWDANTVTHILGVRAFGTQLLCEQVVGRGLRRQSYELNSEGLFDVEYSDILGIPFDFTAKPVVAKPKPPKKTVRVHAVRPERDSLELTFPRVTGYRTETPEGRLTASFNDDSTFTLTPDNVGPAKTVISGIVGKTEELNVEHLKLERQSTILFKLTTYLIETKYRDDEGELQLHLFGQLKRIVRQWLDNHFICKGGTQPAQILIPALADHACERIVNGINASDHQESRIQALLDPYNPTGSTTHVNFTTSKDTWKTAADKSHINLVVTDSEWEAQFAMATESHPAVLSYAKNQGLGLEVPYLLGSDSRRYIPDFLLKVDDGHGPEDPLNLIAEIKGYRGEDAKVKAETMRTYWVPGVNNLGKFGRWAFAEFTEPYSMDSDLSTVIEEMISKALKTPQPTN